MNDLALIRHLLDPTLTLAEAQRLSERESPKHNPQLRERILPVPIQKQHAGTPARRLRVLRGRRHG